MPCICDHGLQGESGNCKLHSGGSLRRLKPVIDSLFLDSAGFSKAGVRWDFRYPAGRRKLVISVGVLGLEPWTKYMCIFDQ
jgi:hypothetical protein